MTSHTQLSSKIRKRSRAPFDQTGNRFSSFRLRFIVKPTARQEVVSVMSHAGLGKRTNGLNKRNCYSPFWPWVARGSRCSCRSRCSCCSSWCILGSPCTGGLCTCLNALLINFFFKKGRKHKSVAARWGSIMNTQKEWKSSPCKCLLSQHQNSGLGVGL